MSGDDASAVELVPFRWWHIEPVMPLERELFGQWSWSVETYWTELAAPGRWYRVALDAGGAVAGWVGLATDGVTADVQTIAVAPTHQGQGLGRVLLLALVHEAAARGASHVLLEVRADNEPAKALYAKCGFEQIAVRKRYYQPGDVDALILQCDLTTMEDESDV